MSLRAMFSACASLRSSLHSVTGLTTLASIDFSAANNTGLEAVVLEQLKGTAANARRNRHNLLDLAHVTTPCFHALLIAQAEKMSTTF